jgi:hypothetical protein
LPANFDVVYNAWRLYNWTGNKTWIENEALKRFYALSMNEYVDHWKLGYDQVTTRSRSMFVENGASKFGTIVVYRLITKVAGEKCFWVLTKRLRSLLHTKPMLKF